MSNCPDCGVSKGEQHLGGCDIARCQDCGGQELSCGCREPKQYPPLTWAGEWPGVAEVPIMACSSEVTAARYGKGKYVQGADCPVEKIPVFSDGKERWVSVRALRIHHPSKEDVAAQKILDDARALVKKKEAALARAREAGLSEEDISILRA